LRRLAFTGGRWLSFLSLSAQTPKVVGDVKIAEDEPRFARVAIPTASAEAEPVSDRGEA
jgi:hypothetical protein